MPQSQKKPAAQTYTGIIAITSRGVGYVTLEGFTEDIEIPHERLNTALPGDTVSIELDRHPRGRLPAQAGRQSGRVTKVVERRLKNTVGVIEKREKGYVLVSDDRRIYRPFVIGNQEEAEGKEGFKALLHLGRWSDPAVEPHGTLREVIGRKGEHETEMRAIVLRHDFDASFPDDVEREAKELESYDISKEHLEGRRDFRKVPTMTIDPPDAKDFDDALSVRKLDNGLTEVGIHIADVSHFVRPKTAIEREAERRGTSVYLVDRTVPMLPEILSNDLCSLVPDEDRLAMSAVFILDRDANVKERSFGETIIHSDKRFSYEEAERVLDTGQGALFSELSLLRELARKLKEKRMEEGSIEFDQEEVRFILDAEGKPVGIEKKPRLETNSLIEEFMLLANREVALFVRGHEKKPSDNLFVYRIHDDPVAEKIEELGIFLSAIGYDLAHKKGKVSQHAIGRLFRQIEGKPEEQLIKVATIRSMAKAIYSTKNIGHFGLSFRHYTHFTSPIRRYPDLMVHRMVKAHLGGKPIQRSESAHYERLAIQSSEREAEAVAAERESVKYKQVEYMKERVGEEFDAVISGAVEWGVYVEEVNTKAEGLVSVRAMKDDFYEYDPRTFSLVGRRTKRRRALGDRVRVRLLAADLDRRQLDFVLV